MAKSVLLLSGPNINLFGTREVDTYGNEPFEKLIARSEKRAAHYGYELRHIHSNHEGDLVDAIQEAIGNTDAIVINAGALTHYGWSIHDALRAFGGVVVELHLSDPTTREEFRYVSVITPVAGATIQGKGPEGYELAIDAVAELLGDK